MDVLIMWGNLVVVPQAGHKRVMEQLHDSHPGIPRMKSLARSFVWWPQMDNDIADRVKSCNHAMPTDTPCSTVSPLTSLGMA